MFVDNFFGWIEAFPTKQETATVVAKKILEEIFLRFRVPKIIRLDNCSVFVYKVSQGLAEILGTIRKPHCVYHPQSSGQIKKINRTPTRDLD